MKRILITRPMPERVSEAARALFEVEMREENTPLKPGQMKGALALYDGIMPTLGDMFSAEIFAEAENSRCRILANFGVGTNHIDVAAARGVGIAVTNTPGAVTDATADIAVMLMLMSARRAGEGERMLRAGRWAGWNPTQMLGLHMTGKTVGIIGLGNIGRLVAGYVKVFGAKAIAYDPYISDADFAERGADKVDFDTLFREADIVSVNCPLNTETRGMVGEKAFSLMKPTSYFITTARGGIADEDALIAALKENRIRGAGLDVFDIEPTGNATNRFVGFDNVLLSPHNAGVTHECNYNMSKAAAEQWMVILRGEKPPRLKNPEVWDKYTERYERIFGQAVAAE